MSEETAGARGAQVLEESLRLQADASEGASGGPEVGVENGEAVGPVEEPEGGPPEADAAEGARGGWG